MSTFIGWLLFVAAFAVLVWTGSFSWFCFLLLLSGAALLDGVSKANNRHH